MTYISGTRVGERQRRRPMYEFNEKVKNKACYLTALACAPTCRGTSRPATTHLNRSTRAPLLCCKCSSRNTYTHTRMHTNRSYFSRKHAMSIHAPVRDSVKRAPGPTPRRPPCRLFQMRPPTIIHSGVKGACSAIGDSSDADLHAETSGLFNQWSSKLRPRFKPSTSPHRHLSAVHATQLN